MTKRLPTAPEDIVPDAELWESIKQAVEPLRPRAVRPSVPLKGPHPGPRSRTARFHAAAAPPSAATEPPRLTGLERRMAQKLMRGQVRYEAKLDLHGYGANEARAALAGFLKISRASGRCLVLVVTGKGTSPFARHTLHGDTHYHVPERGGRLRRLVSEWLHEPEFRQHVSGFQPAHPKHGGGGAYYLKLRRPVKTLR